LRWYAENRRSLPWRDTNDAYAIWVSEVMLQQTQVKTVVGYFERWMRRFPTLRALAEADESDVLHAFQGLGYYSRARRLWQGARLVVRDHSGIVPSDPRVLTTIPGMGAYTAGAVASIAYGVPAPIVDGNVTRVLCRVFDLEADPTRAPLKRALWDIAARFSDVRAQAGSVNQALMELGATLCTVRAPACRACPWSSRCSGRAAGRELQLPRLPVRARPEQHRVAAGIVRRGERVLVVRTPRDAARWASLWVFPHGEQRARETPGSAAQRATRDCTGVDTEVVAELGSIKYTITRHRFTLAVIALRCARGARLDTRRDARWHTPSELEELAMPAAHRRLARSMRGRVP
jgi:A/G-specific adenine glycosylase